MYFSISKAAGYIGVSISTLRRWDKEGYLKPDFRSQGGHRRYDLSALRARFMLPSLPSKQAHALGYVRVSSHDQSDDLDRQEARLKKHLSKNFSSFEILRDLGSGLNCKKPGLRKLLRLIFEQKITHLVLSHKDRLLRFGSEIIFELCKFFGVRVIILQDQESECFEIELTRDVIELMTVFCARLYGKRAHTNKKALAA